MAKSQKEVLRQIREIYGFDQKEDKSKLLNLLRLLTAQSQTVPPIQPITQSPETVPPTVENVGTSLTNEQIPKLAKDYPFPGSRKRYNQNGG
jgi:hypothetical protein